MANQIKFPLNEVQIELLKVFDKKLDDKEMQELKDFLLDLKFRKFQKSVEASVQDKNYSSNDLEKMNKEHLRTTYKSNKNLALKNP